MPIKPTFSIIINTIKTPHQSNKVLFFSVLDIDAYAEKLLELMMPSLLRGDFAFLVQPTIMPNDTQQIDKITNKIIHGEKSISLINKDLFNHGNPISGHVSMYHHKLWLSYVQGNANRNRSLEQTIYNDAKKGIEQGIRKSTRLIIIPQEIMPSIDSMQTRLQELNDKKKSKYDISAIEQHSQNCSTALYYLILGGEKNREQGIAPSQSTSAIIKKLSIDSELPLETRHDIIDLLAKTGISNTFEEDARIESESRQQMEYSVSPRNTSPRLSN